MDVGTTITAQIAALGANLSARRTAAAHLGLGQRWLAGPIAADPEFALTAFHTGFNLLGVALLLPFTQSFARLIQALLPSPDGRAADDLDEPPSADTGRALDLAQAAQQRPASGEGA